MVFFRGREKPRSVSVRGLIQNFRRASPPLSYAESPRGAFSPLALIHKGATSPRAPPFVSSARFWYVVRTWTFYQNRQSVLLAGQKYKSTSKSISWLLQLSRGGGGGGHSREVWVEVSRRGPQTPTLFKTKITHFATLIKTGDTTFWPWFVLFCIQN